MKTSTGYAEKGATVEAVRLMRKYLPASVKIKASGGIRDFDFAHRLIEAGVQNDRSGLLYDRPHEVVQRHRRIVRVAADEIGGTLRVVVTRVADRENFPRSHDVFGQNGSPVAIESG